MPRKLKVYGWTSSAFLPRDHPIFSDESWKSHHSQFRAVIAAHSMAEAAKLTGHKHPRQMFCLTETGNDRDIEAAMSRPGVQFVTPDNGPPRPYYAVEPRTTSS